MLNPDAIIGAILFAIALAGGGYYEGWERRGDHEAAAALKVERAAAADRAALVEQIHQVERKAASDMAAIDQQHQEAIQNEKAATDRTIADLLDGTLRLRKRLAAVQRSASNLPSATAGTGSSDDAESVGLQKADAEFLLRTAAEADSVADQLRACQAVVRADRAVHAQ